MLQRMVQYCEGRHCLRRYILKYFGEEPSWQRCEKCGNCDQETVEEDRTFEVRNICQCIDELKGRFGLTMVCDILKGSQNAKVKRYGFQNKSSFGLLQSCSGLEIRDMVKQAVEDGYLEQSEGKYPVLSLTASGRDVLAGKVARAADGFEEGSLLAYAAAHLKPLARQENRELTDVTVSRLSADAENKKVNAERNRLKLEREKGLLMPRSEFEENMAARALFFRNEIENFGLRKAGEIIELVRGDPALQDAFLSWWREETEDWMDAWSGDMQFGGVDDGDDAGPEEA